ncbi:MAG TPA: amino acid permease [Bryobacteraceae bacterium]|jgi:APA family basic amino acid/polyamine antiporter|nr:amino acid permease [Bryobacteraceae bacterium]
MNELPRRLGLLDACLIVIGIVIGAGIFLIPNIIARSLPSAPAILAVWIAAGVLSYFGALAYAELGAMMPETGGQYVYLREAFGPGCAFLSGWIFLLAVVPGSMAFLAVSFSIYLRHFVPLSPAAGGAVSAALLAVLTAANYIGVKPGAWIQRIFTSLKIAGLLLLIGAAIVAPHAAGRPPVPSPPVSYHGIGLALTACLLAYNGWSYVSFVAGELKDPQRNLPRATTLGIVAVIALYLGANIAYLNVLSVPEIAATERVGAAVAARTMGPAGATVLSVVVLLSIIGAINGNILTGARIPFAQARDGLFFARFGRVHPRFETPAFAIVAQTAWTIVLVITGSYETLFAYTMLSSWIVYTLGVAAVWVLRRKSPAAPRPYKMWGYPYTMWAFLIVSVWYMVDAMVNQPKPSLMAGAVCAAGIPFYLYWRTRARAAVTVSEPM